MASRTVPRRIVIEQSCRPAADPCVCRDIVERAHASMLEKGADSGSALESAVRVFRYHHPETSQLESRNLVEQWVLGRHLH